MKSHHINVLHTSTAGRGPYIFVNKMEQSRTLRLQGRRSRDRFICLAIQLVSKCCVYVSRRVCARVLRVAHAVVRPPDVVVATFGGTTAFLAGSQRGLDAVVARVVATAIARHLRHRAVLIAIRLQRVGLRVGVVIDRRTAMLRVTHLG